MLTVWVYTPCDIWYITPEDEHRSQSLKYHLTIIYTYVQRLFMEQRC